jgi:hypothetical protein
MLSRGYHQFYCSISHNFLITSCIGILNPQVIRYRNVSRLCRGAIFKISTRSLCHTTAEANRTGLKKYLIPITLSAIGITAYTLISIKNNIECIKAFEVLQHLREEHDGDLPLFSRMAP